MKGNILVEYLLENGWIAINEMTYQHDSFKGIEIFFDNSTAAEIWFRGEFKDQQNCYRVNEFVELLKRNDLLLKADEK